MGSERLGLHTGCYRMGRAECHGAVRGCNCRSLRLNARAHHDWQVRSGFRFTPLAVHALPGRGLVFVHKKPDPLKNQTLSLAQKPDPLTEAVRGEMVQRPLAMRSFLQSQGVKRDGARLLGLFIFS